MNCTCHECTRKTFLSRVVLLTVIAGSIFQLGHFVEHATQAYKWFGDRTHAYMSPLAMWLTHHIGSHFTGSMAYQHVVGMEILHLCGNMIFLTTLFGMYVLVPLYKNVNWQLRWAIYVETFHLNEHITLTATALHWGKAYGFSTLFGFDMGPEWTVGYRVLWHFFMNAIPTALVVWSLWVGHQRKHQFSYLPYLEREE